MEIVSLVCPSCGAKLEANPRLKQGVCNYCGTPFMIDDKKIKIELDNIESVGYEFERGRYNAQNEGADPELIEAVGALIEPVCGLSDMYIKERNRMNDLKREEERVRFLTSDSGRYIPAGVCAGACFLFALLMLGAGGGARMFLIGLIIACVGFALVYLLQPAYVQSVEESVKEKTAALEDLKKEIRYFESVLEKYDADIIPETYQNRVAMTFIYNALRDKRAITIHQAINLYEEELRLQRERELQERQMQLQEEQLRLQREQLEQMEEAEEERRASQRNSQIAGAVATGAIVAGGALLANKKARKAAGKVAGAVIKGIIGL